MNSPAYLMADVRRASARRKFRVVSLFANIGGFDIGAMRAGGHVVIANEISPVARRIYGRNFPDTPVDPRDAREIARTPADTKTFLARAGQQPGEVDFMTGGPPCNRITSLASHALLPRSPEDTRSLLLEFGRLVRHAQPRIAIGENVAMLAVRHPRLLSAVLDFIRFGNDGQRRYFASYAMLCASRYGAPQVRRRTIFLCIRTDLAEAIGITAFLKNIRPRKCGRRIAVFLLASRRNPHMQTRQIWNFIMAVNMEKAKVIRVTEGRVRIIRSRQKRSSGRALPAAIASLCQFLAITSRPIPAKSQEPF